jgi:hypothetical protein
MSTAMIELDTESQQSNDHTLLDTPTNTTDTVPGPGHEVQFAVEQGIECVPWPDRTYMIRNRASDWVLAREHGRLVLKGIADLATCGWHWTCVEKNNGWFGFRETSSGAYLGRDGRGGFIASATRHEGWEYFDVRRHPDGGYQLLSIRWWERMRMVADMRTQGVVEIAGSGNEGVAATLWDFVQV